MTGSSEPRPSTTVCALRDAGAGLEVLMVRRSPTARFMGGAWVFPGGVVDPEDGSDRVAALVGGVERTELSWVAAGVREFVEEVGLWITSDPFVRRIDHAAKDAVWTHAERLGVRFDGAAPVLFANWITPTMVPVRFDARFYATVVPAGLDCVPDDVEIDALDWLAPAAVVADADAGDMIVPFPTRKNLELLAGFETAAAMVAHYAALDVIDPIQPRMRVSDRGALEVLVPGDPGFDDLNDDGPDPDVLRRVARAAGVPEVAD